MKDNQYLIIRFFEMILGVAITAIGLSLMIKSGLGQTAITAFTQNIVAISGIKSGTILIIFFLSCTVLQILILRKEFECIQLLQIIVALVQGQIVNMICYDLPLISTFLPTNYFSQWLFLLSGIFGCSFGVAIVFKAQFIRNPFEELAMVLSKKMNREFSTFRMHIDIFFMGLSLIMIIIFQLDFTTLREGTWVSMLILGKSMKFTFPMAEKVSLYCRKTKNNVKELQKI